MKLQYYKPNAKNQGTACSFNVQTKAKGIGSDGKERNVRGVYMEMIKQTSWDKQKKVGGFKDGEKINIKFSKTEAASIIDTFERMQDTRMFHTTGDSSTSIQIKPWVTPQGEYKGFGLTVKQGDSLFRIPFTPGEVVEIREWLKFALQRTFTAMYNDYKKSRSTKTSQ